MKGIQKKQRLLTMIFGAFAIFFTGYPHVWSIYQPYVMEQAGWSQGQASMCFYLALSTFVFGNIVGGRMQNRFKEKTIVWIGGGIFAAGILASAFLIVPTPLPMYLSYGVMQGFGQGMIYTVILATVQRWFPDRTGFASGVVVTANGLCGFFLAPLSRKLLEAEGVQKTLLIVGVAITVSWILCGIFFGMKHTGENYGFVMFGIVFATFGAPAISGLVRGNGYGMNVVFGIGAVFAVIAFVCLTLLGRNLVKERAEKSVSTKIGTAL